jgi:hypothetical protein
MTFFGPILALVLLGQAQANRGPTGEVVDEQGKPVAGAQVVFYAPPVVYGEGGAVELRTRSDTEGKFNLKVPRLERILVNGVNFLAYQPGRAITAHAFARRPYRLVLEKPSPRSVKVEGPDGRPVAGARVVPRVVNIFNNVSADIPASLADSVTATTGPDGQATITYLAARDQLVAVRVTADAIGTQDIRIMDRPGRGSQESVIAIKLKPTSRLAGRIVDPDGRPVASRRVEVWSKGDGGWLLPNRVELTGGPLETDADGSFQTPANLMVGTAYRVAVHEAGKEPILSDWLTTGARPRTLPLIVLRPLRVIRGRVLDRQGKPVANIEVFQSGDGPERTTTQTDGDGYFSLGGFHQGPVFLFARGPGYHFQGQLVKTTERNVTVELTRLSARPAREMTMLPDPIPHEESRALARRLVEPLWETAGKSGEDSEKYNALRLLAAVDPARVLDRLPSVKFESDGRKNRLYKDVVLALAGNDFEEATAVAESIADPAMRASALVSLADRLPASDRDHKLALLARALLHARLASEQGERLRQMGEVADRWYDLGEVVKAKELFAECSKIANQLTDKTDDNRLAFAIRLARVDLPTAVAIANKHEGVLSKIPSLAHIDQSSDDETADLSVEFHAWSLFDPRAAVARLEKISVGSSLSRNVVNARLRVAQSLARSRDERWRECWKNWDVFLDGKNGD